MYGSYYVKIALIKTGNTMIHLQNCFNALSNIHPSNAISRGLVRTAQSFVCWLGRVIYKIDLSKTQTPSQETALKTNQAASNTLTSSVPTHSIAPVTSHLMEETGRVSISCRNVSGQPIIIDMFSYQTAYTLRQKLAEHLSVSVEQIHLIFMGMPVADEITIAETEMVNETVVMFTITEPDEDFLERILKQGSHTRTFLHDLEPCR